MTRTNEWCLFVQFIKAERPCASPKEYYCWLEVTNSWSTLPLILYPIGACFYTPEVHRCFTMDLMGARRVPKWVVRVHLLLLPVCHKVRSLVRSSQRSLRWSQFEKGSASGGGLWVKGSCHSLETARHSSEMITWQKLCLPRVASVCAPPILPCRPDHHSSTEGKCMSSLRSEWL